MGEQPPSRPSNLGFKDLLLIFQICNVVVTSVAFVGPWNPIRNNYSYIWSCAFTLILSIGFWILFKLSLNALYKRMRTSQSERCETNLIIGLGSVTLFGVIPQIFVMVNDCDEDRFTWWLTCNIISFSIIVLFVKGHFDEYQVKNNATDAMMLRAIVILAHGLLVFVLAYITEHLGIFRQSNVKFDSFYYHFFHFLTFSPCFAEFVVVLRNGICVDLDDEKEKMVAREKIFDDKAGKV